MTYIVFIIFYTEIIDLLKSIVLSLQFLWTLMVFLGLITTVWHLSVGGHILYQQVQSLTQTPTSKVLLLFFKPSC